VGDQILLAPPGREDLDQLSGTAATVWILLEEPQTLQELVSTLGELYNTPVQAIRASVEQLVNDLVSRGSIRQVEGLA